MKRSSTGALLVAILAGYACNAGAGNALVSAVSGHDQSRPEYSTKPVPRPPVAPRNGSPAPTDAKPLMTPAERALLNEQIRASTSARKDLAAQPAR
jgi:hypothetical protein